MVVFSSTVFGGLVYMIAVKQDEETLESNGESRMYSDTQIR